MGKLFKTNVPNFLADYMYQLPFSLMQNAIAQDNSLKDNLIQQTELIENAGFKVKHLNNPEHIGFFKEETDNLRENIDRIAKGIRSGELSYQQGERKIKNLEREFVDNITSGNLYQLSQAVKDVGEFERLNHSVRVSNPDYYQASLNYYMNEMLERTKKSGKIEKFNGKVIPKKPVFLNKELSDNLNNIEAEKTDSKYNNETFKDVITYERDKNLIGEYIEKRIKDKDIQSYLSHYQKIYNKLPYGHITGKDKDENYKFIDGFEDFKNKTVDNLKNIENVFSGEVQGIIDKMFKPIVREVPNKWKEFLFKKNYKKPDDDNNKGGKGKDFQSETARISIPKSYDKKIEGTFGFGEKEMNEIIEYNKNLEEKAKKKYTEYDHEIEETEDLDPIIENMKFGSEIMQRYEIIRPFVKNYLKVDKNTPLTPTQEEYLDKITRALVYEDIPNTKYDKRLKSTKEWSQDNLAKALLTKKELDVYKRGNLSSYYYINQTSSGYNPPKIVADYSEKNKEVAKQNQDRKTLIKNNFLDIFDDNTLDIIKENVSEKYSKLDTHKEISKQPLKSYQRKNLKGFVKRNLSKLDIKDVPNSSFSREEQIKFLKENEVTDVDLFSGTIYEPYIIRVKATKTIGAGKNPKTEDKYIFMSVNLKNRTLLNDYLDTQFKPITINDSETKKEIEIKQENRKVDIYNSHRPKSAAINAYEHLKSGRPYIVSEKEDSLIRLVLKFNKKKKKKVIYEQLFFKNNEGNFILENETEIDNIVNFFNTPDDTTKQTKK